MWIHALTSLTPNEAESGMVKISYSTRDLKDCSKSFACAMQVGPRIVTLSLMDVAVITKCNWIH